MDFLLTAEQDLLRDSITRFALEHGDFAKWRRALPAGPHNQAAWSQMAELGWLAIAVPEAAGGLGGSAVETMLVMEGLGRALSREPYVGTAVIAPALIDDPAILAAIIAGETRIALAVAETGNRFNLAAAETTATGGTLTGTKSFVHDGATADWFIVSAQTGPALTLHLVPRDAPGLTITPIRGPDHRHHARLTLANTPTRPLQGGLDALESAVDRAIAAHLAEAVGSMEALRDMTLAYLKTREQFGATIGSFQALQHRMVDIALACEEARSMLYFATLRLDAPAPDRRIAVSAAKTRIGQTARFVAHQSVQLHGGIGTSDELPVSHHLKRLMIIETLYGNSDHHRARFAAATDAA